MSKNDDERIKRLMDAHKSEIKILKEFCKRETERADSNGQWASTMEVEVMRLKYLVEEQQDKLLCDHCGSERLTGYCSGYCDNDE